MDFYEIPLQLSALVGFDAEGQKAIIAIVTAGEVHKAAGMIFEYRPDVVTVIPHEIEIRRKAIPGEEYTRDEWEGESFPSL